MLPKAIHVHIFNKKSPNGGACPQGWLFAWILLHINNQASDMMRPTLHSYLVSTPPKNGPLVWTHYKSIPFHKFELGLSIPHGHNLMSCIRKSFGKCRPSVISTYRFACKNANGLLPPWGHSALVCSAAAAASGPVSVDGWSDLKLKTEFMLLFSAVVKINEKSRATSLSKPHRYRPLHGH